MHNSAMTFLFQELHPIHCIHCKWNKVVIRSMACNKLICQGRTKVMTSVTFSMVFLVLTTIIKFTFLSEIGALEFCLIIIIIYYLFSKICITRTVVWSHIHPEDHQLDGCYAWKLTCNVFISGFVCILKTLESTWFLSEQDHKISSSRYIEG